MVLSGIWSQRTLLCSFLCQRRAGGNDFVQNTYQADNFRHTGTQGACPVQTISRRLKILNIWTDPVSMPEALRRIESFITDGKRPHAVFAANPEKNYSVPRDAQLYETFRNADLLIPDGIGIVLAARVLYRMKFSRVPGVELMGEICRRAAERDFGVFIYGAKEEVSRKAAEELASRYPNLRIAGRANGYVSEAEMPDLISKINASGAVILFLALGSPRQEKWYSRYRNQLTSVRVCQGIGGSLDTLAGTTKRAPAWWCRNSLEWLYRLLAEPSRIGRQKVLPLFAAQVFLTWLRHPRRVNVTP
jgi:N-acetylglucosaminyldiphosphoundecaprenol N-acetyl-beta-D-mannosaminyltransferase